MDLGIKSKVRIPQDWSEISLHQFRKINALDGMEKQMKLEDFIVEVVHTATGVDKELILTMDIKKLETLLIQLSRLTNSQIPVINEPFIEIDGVLYMMDLNFNILTFGQYIDLNMFPKDAKDKWDYADSICSVFLRPVEKKNSLLIKGKKLFKVKPNIKDYKISKYNAQEAIKNAEIFLHKLPMTYVYTILCFFLSLMQIYVDNILGYSNQLDHQKELVKQ